MRRMGLVPPWRSLALATAALIVAAAPGAPSALAWSRSALILGEGWRVWTGHLVHASGYHLGWNLLPLVGLGWIWERYLGAGYWSLLAVSAVTVSVGLFLLEPELSGYVGLSGLLNGLWVGGALQASRWHDSRGDSVGRKMTTLLASAVAVKLGVEIVTGVPLFTDEERIGASAVPLAHALGALGGLGWIAGAPPCRRYRRTYISKT